MSEKLTNQKEKSLVYTNDLKVSAEYARLHREFLMKDAYRPGYHFACIDDIALPGDPNGAFFKDGIYHLMYLYNRSSDKQWKDTSYRWGHISSIDLVHWRHHQDAIFPSDGDGGCWSGGAFMDDDGTAYISYWSVPPKGEESKGSGIGFAKSNDKFYEKWEKIDSAFIEGTGFGILETVDDNGNPIFLGNADPSNIWKSNGYYYVQTGNLVVLNEYGRNEDSKECFKGDWVDLYKSKDLLSWEYVHRFYQRDVTNKWTDESEDDMCPSFLPLPESKDGGVKSDKYLQLFIAHNRGCQYYIGEYNERDEKFYPESHGRMSWIDNAFFAPEALIDGKGRHIMWAWLADNPVPFDKELVEKGWSGVYSLPRLLWLGDDKTLRIAPVPELKILRYNEKKFEAVSLNSECAHHLCDVESLSHEIELMIDVTSAEKVGIKLITNQDSSEYTTVYYDSAINKLVIDTEKSGEIGKLIIERAPFTLAKGELLNLNIYIDKSIIEVFVNERQAIARRMYPTDSTAPRIVLFAQGGAAQFKEIKVWDIAPSNPY